MMRQAYLLVVVAITTAGLGGSRCMRFSGTKDPAAAALFAQLACDMCVAAQQR
jgi:hypothetical protein